MDSPAKTSPIPGAKPPWKPGQSGNPSGRKKLTKRQRQYADLAEQKFHEIVSPEELGLVMESLLRDAKKPGNYRSKELVLAYALGKPKIKIEHQKSGMDRLNELLDAMPDVIAVPVATYTVEEQSNEHVQQSRSEQASSGAARQPDAQRRDGGQAADVERG